LISTSVIVWKDGGEVPFYDNHFLGQDLSPRLLEYIGGYFDVCLTVHLTITLANNQLDAQFLYFIISLRTVINLL